MNPWCWCVILTFLANKSVIIYFFINTKRITCHFEFVFWCVQFDFLSEWKIFLSYPISLTCCSLNHIIHWELYKTSSFWISSFSCSKLLCVVVWYCKTKLNPGTENQRKPFHVVQKKKKRSFWTSVLYQFVV